MSGKGWQFWLDVGGTFTDCIGRAPDGALSTCKLLSSGVFKGHVSRNAEGRSIRTELAAQVPDDFFADYTIAFPGRSGAADDSIRVVSSKSDGRIVLERDPEFPIREGDDLELRGGEPAPVLGIRRLLGIGLAEPIGPARVRLGTTRGTNALLERKGARVGLLITRGFADLPLIGSQSRPRLFELKIAKPTPLHELTVELDERIDSSGKVIKPIDDDAIRAALDRLAQHGIEAVAVCLLNSYQNPEHEQRIASAARQRGFQFVSASSELTSTIGMLDRCDTAIVDAYLSPVVRRYVEQVQSRMPEAELKLMTSAGGLVAAEHFMGRDSLLSGPAGGVVGFARVAEEAGFDKAIGFDMGGTSTDVARFDGRFEHEYQTEKAGVRIVAPMFAIETVAAGGGSICRFDGQKLLVGPRSAGADPGPLCYGRGGPLTITDINLYNGKIDSDRFPFRLDSQAVEAALEAMAEQVRQNASADQPELDARALANGFTKIANLTMAGAIRTISAARGFDPAKHALIAFGGAGAQHACAIARLLGIGRIVLHPMAGVLSSLGLGMADVHRFAQTSVLKRLDDAQLKTLESTFSRFAERLCEEVRMQGVEERAIQPAIRMLDLRYEGEDATITVHEPDDGDWAERFKVLHEQLYGHAHSDRPIEIATLRVEVVGRMPKPSRAESDERDRTPSPRDTCTAWFDGTAHRAAVYDRADLEPGDTIEGPAIITEDISTIVIDPGWTAKLTGRGDLLLNDLEAGPGRAAGEESTRRDPIRLELFTRQLTHIAEQMGRTLQRTSLSVNVKQRLDFSCAILDGQGELVVNAPHIPVHLGAIGPMVKALIERGPKLRPGDVVVCNDPGLGGSHLPDVTVMTPLFAPDGRAIRFFTASRAHHAEIGGMHPGSSFPFARNLAEEGVVLRNLLVVRDGRFRERELLEALQSGTMPSRTPAENIADIRAAVAANHAGSTQLLAVIEQEGWPVIEAFMAHIRDAAEEKTRAAIRRLAEGVYTHTDQLDDGDPIVATLKIDDGRMTIDFTGSAPVRPDSLNANLAVVRSAVLYCLRCLVAEEIPLNAGALAAVDLVVPEGLLNPPSRRDPGDCAAVVGGNVEISQRVVDVIFGALGTVAASQGTMNNLVFGDETFGYYETIGGGTGAGDGFAGADAVHSHMTNTRITDVEILERRYPVRLIRFAIRRGSGGHGRWRGGDGIERAIEFLAPVSLSLLTQRRMCQPYGREGGSPGMAGRNILTTPSADGGKAREEILPPLAQCDIKPGQILTILTPGGGGWGPEG
ncbi:MAG: hydantoinase B/oxoprolinase family protein [Phycisphaeraceae bacterium]|nr:hydantoinase B/oxoprolinase family protein [Phycisphaeraceae bacterium]